ncbi:glucose-1-phosphate cytidylyltransferase [Paenibacillus apiarius]|uniref:Glucose-1-phosphate cytidylyltransferase n=1 Tax=Paenibacillus apiarius TaxID=46240 RepID=A0ABT4DUP5_9BACL|nr:glucose-1-phosphate cytidylyltransferase [Paenibacillus apiarius]MCY9512567.1 glucose-1-phosphate cytidylyltransferase [Paenibacillus apiarius]MCY9519838.1 glucose-1-phosphate cytidylyltransferase [Paenibacillus apiarius]MCY9553155.1 glucose-1-phosphate cytidylyltransferase [Paenibacillus apiarius]MCY9559277.1 glucose-1-phosphate cytidylyltransferase [Paenibacillus apiarius]MCY9682636.1 glucose-1-phosphate cytidylyltransferase [Paenibacillus apiarius]
MKVVILAGGYGTRISEESQVRPKPMIEIGDRPILHHIMSIYSRYGYHDFVLCLGYKGYMIKEYFANYYLHRSDVTFDFSNQNQMSIHQHCAEPWRVTLVDTGRDTMTGGRLKRVQRYVGDEPFMLTYGDGLANINIAKLVECHHSHGKLATVTATLPGGRFGALQMQDNQVTGFQEKPVGEGGWINAGFFVMNPGVFSYIRGDETVLEQDPLERLAHDGELMAFPFTGFWHPMDTLRDKKHLEQLWKTGNAPWSQ